MTTILERPLYDEPLAASILGISPSTLHWWLEGRKQGTKVYAPVLRPEPTGSREVTWGEFVEARFLREYRRTLEVPLPSIRAFIADLRSTLDIPYPLATARPWVGPGRRLLLDAQNSAGLPSDLWVAFEPHTGQMLLTHPAESFLERVEFDDDETGVVVRVHPDGPRSPVVIDPEIRFGSPTVQGIPTEALAELVDAGDSIESVAVDFNLPLVSVVAAIRYEQLAEAA
jgi:uncharacterized protein (DUF433 family)